MVHGLHDGQGLHPNALGTQLIAAVLVALLDHGAAAYQGGAALVHQVDEPPQGIAHRQEVVYDQHPILRGQKPLGHHHIIGGAVGKGRHLGLIHIAGNVLGLALFGKYQGAGELQRYHAAHGNAGGLNGENFVHPGVLIKTVELPPHLFHKRKVNLVVQKAIHLKNITFIDLALGENFLF